MNKHLEKGQWILLEFLIHTEWKKITVKLLDRDAKNGWILSAKFIFNMLTGTKMGFINIFE